MVYTGFAERNDPGVGGGGMVGLIHVPKCEDDAEAKIRSVMRNMLFSYMRKQKCIRAVAAQLINAFIFATYM